ncbi:hypothetical protein Tco_0973619 [Tanacetum coccineum]
MKGECQRWMSSGIGEFPFTYLGLPIGENMRRVNAWGHVVEKFKIREETDGAGLEFSSSYIGVLGDERILDSKKRVVCGIKDRGSMTFGFAIENGLEALRLGEDDEVTVKELVKLIEEKVLHVECGGHKTIWKNLVPKEVNIIVLRGLSGRLLVRVELDKRDIYLDLVLFPCVPKFIAQRDDQKSKRYKSSGDSSFNTRDLREGSFNLNNTVVDEEDEVQEVCLSRPMGRDQAKRKGKALMSSSSSTAGADLEEKSYF